MSRTLKRLAAVGLVVGGLFGLAGSFAPSASLRGVAWGIDGMGLVMASALLTVGYLKVGQELVAAGFLVFAVGQGLIVSGAAMSLTESTPSFGAGAGLWAVGLMLISAPRVFPPVARLLGIVASILFGITALRIFAGAPLVPTSSPLPFFIYPLFVATLGAWAWSLLEPDR